MKEWVKSIDEYLTLLLLKLVIMLIEKMIK